MTMPTFTDGAVVHDTDLNKLSTGINNLSTYTLGAVPPRSYNPTLRLRRVAAFSVANSTNTPVSWDTIDVNNDTMFTLSAPSTITIQTAGSYALTVEWGWASNTTGDRVMWGTKNGTSTTANAVATDEAHAVGLITGRGNTMHIATVLPSCIVGDTFFVLVFQNSGGALNSTTIQPVPSLSMWRIGP